MIVAGIKFLGAAIRSHFRKYMIIGLLGHTRHDERAAFIKNGVGSQAVAGSDIKPILSVQAYGKLFC